jgi:hypothetical protein
MVYPLSVVQHEEFPQDTVVKDIRNSTANEKVYMNTAFITQDLLVTSC